MRSYTETDICNFHLLAARRIFKFINHKAWPINRLTDAGAMFNATIFQIYEQESKLPGYKKPYHGARRGSAKYNIMLQ